MRKWWRNWKYHRAIKLVRREMGLLGCPLFHLTDEELEDRMQAIGDAMLQVSLTIEECGRNFGVMLDALGEINKNKQEEQHANHD